MQGDASHIMEGITLLCTQMEINIFLIVVSNFAIHSWFAVRFQPDSWMIKQFVHFIVVKMDKLPYSFEKYFNRGGCLMMIM